jgi:chemotaxis methyl-accepting protein methylase
MASGAKINKNGMNVKTVNFIQVNVGKRIAATQNLDGTCCRNVVGLVQEPYLKKMARPE